MSTPYTRSAILAWANEVLEASHANFQELPAHEVGLLLYGVFQTASASAAAASAPGSAAPSVQLLEASQVSAHHQRHQRTCLRYLQLLQFPQSQTAADGAGISTTSSRSSSNGGGGVAVSLSAAQQHRNAEHVLAMIHALSGEEAELLRVETAHTPVTEEAASANVVLALGPAMTPSAWLSGRAFVEELKLWRWMRLMAERHHSSVGAIRRAVRAYLQHGDASGSDCTSGGALASTPPPAVSRDPSPAPRVPAAHEVSPAEVHTIGAPHARTGEGVDDTPDDVLQHELKRMKPELPPSASPLPLIGSISPEPVAAETGKTTAVTGELVATAPQQWSAIDRAGVQTSGSTAHTTVAATTTPHVARVPQLHAALLQAQAALQSELTQHRAAQLALQTSAASSTASPRTSGDAASSGAAVSAVLSLPHVAAPGDALETSCRQHMVRQLHSAPDGGGSATGAPASPLPEGLTCAVCPSLMAHAIQCNLAALDEMTAIRGRAVAACLKKDPVALLAALQHIV